MPQRVVAQNSNVKIELDKNSIFSVYDDHLAYTNGNDLYVATNDKITALSSAFEGVALEMQLNANNIIILSELRSDSGAPTKMLNIYDLGADIVKNTTILDELAPQSFPYKDILHLSIGADGKFYCLLVDGINEIDLTNKQITQTRFTNKNDLFTFDCFIIVDNFLYATSAKTLFKIPQDKAYRDTNLDTYIISSDRAYFNIATQNNKIFANSTEGIFSIAPDGVSTKLIDTPDFSGNLACASVGEINYLFIKSLKDLSIKQYIITDDGLFYINSFDKTEYVHPTDFPIIKVASATNALSAVVSPKNLQRAFSLESGELTLILSEHEHYYYAVNTAGLFGYIDKTSAITFLDASATTALGVSAQALHPDTKIYKYPFSSSDEVATIDIFTRLVVIDNVASNADGAHVWGWYKVSFKDSKSNIVTGYIHQEAVSPYVELRSPSIIKSAKIKTKQIGTLANLYRLPNAESELLATLTDGAEISLPDSFDKNSEWTAVKYKDFYGFVKTSEIQLNGLTSVQITVIAIVSATLGATICVVAVIFIRKRKLAH